jgi:iron complex transport system substrate-binding protein
MIRRCALLLCTLLPVLQQTLAAEAAPQRVMSLNLCADQLLLALLPPQRIVSLTWLSSTEGDPQWLPVVRKLPANHGSAEEVLAARPDLVIAGAFTTSATRQLLQRTATPLLQLQPAQDWDDIRRVTREVAAAVGEVARGEQLLAQMDATLAQLAATQPAQPLRVIGWSGGSDVPGRDTLFDAILTAAGAVNVGAAAQGRSDFDLEQLLQLRPEVLMRGAAYASTPSVRNEVAAHRVVRKLYAGKQLTYPEAVYGCGVPRAAALALQLRGQLLSLRAAHPQVPQ